MSTIEKEKIYDRDVLDLTKYGPGQEKEKQDAINAYKTGEARTGIVDKVTGFAKDIINGRRKFFTREKVDTRSASYWEDYYCGSDVVVLIGDTWVDDIITIQYTNTNNKSPIYGYMSEEFDAVAKGTRIIQGQFAIAFKEIGYLYNILDRFESANKGVEVVFGEGKSKFRIEDSDEEPTSVLQPLNSKEIIQSKRLPDRFGYVENRNSGGYVKVSGFDIIVSFGDVSEKNRGGTVDVINNCHITSRSIVCEPTGEPIAEIYSFFGRALNKYIPKYRYTLSQEEEGEEENITDKEMEDELKVVQAPKLDLSYYKIRENIYNEHFKDDLNLDVSFIRNTDWSLDPKLNSIIVKSTKDLSEYGTKTYNPEGVELDKNIKKFVKPTN